MRSTIVFKVWCLVYLIWKKEIVFKDTYIWIVVDFPLPGSQLTCLPLSSLRNSVVSRLLAGSSLLVCFSVQLPFYCTHLINGTDIVIFRVIGTPEFKLIIKPLVGHNISNMKLAELGFVALMEEMMRI
ncbi:hypothetical protein QQ045_008979 [Rhodiola kirilowii]